MNGKGMQSGKHSAAESGAKDTRSPDASRLSGAFETARSVWSAGAFTAAFLATDRGGESFLASSKFARLDLPDGHPAPESGAKDTRSPDASRLRGVVTDSIDMGSMRYSWATPAASAFNRWRSAALANGK